MINSALPFGFKPTEQAVWTIPSFSGIVVCNMHPGLPQAADLQSRSMSCSWQRDACKAFLRMPMHTVQALSKKGDGDASHDKDASRDCEGCHAGTVKQGQR